MSFRGSRAEVEILQWKKLVYKESKRAREQESKRAREQESDFSTDPEDPLVAPLAAPTLGTPGRLGMILTPSLLWTGGGEGNPHLPPSHLVHGQEVELLLEVVGHLELPPPGLQGDDLALRPLGQVPLAPVANTWEIDLNIDFSIVMLTSGITEVFQKESKKNSLFG